MSQVAVEESTQVAGTSPTGVVDVVIAGAGFAGLYLAHRLSQDGYTVQGFDMADGVGGTWYWNRYPGARCDIQSIDYSYSFDEGLEKEWQWSERYATQPEILRYLNHVADRFDLRKFFRFSTGIASARWDEDNNVWILRTSAGDELRANHYVMATGTLSVPKAVEFDGVEHFKGEVYLTGRWPHEPVSFAGKRVAVIGTGSSGIQSIPIIAQEAEHLTVFQRTPNFAMPAHNGPVSDEKKALLEADRAAYREAARWSRAGVPRDIAEKSVFEATPEERNAVFERAWDSGDLLALSGTYNDVLASEEANAFVAEFIREKIRSIVHDPEIAELLCPKDHPFGTKRPCLDTGYYDTYNRPNVRLVDLRSTPITKITDTGIDTSSESMDFDVIVFATGFDAMTGAIVSVDITGRGGQSLADKWVDGPTTYLGLTVSGFPNLFLITGPGSPSVLSNMAVSIEQHVDWITDTLNYMRTEGYDTIEATPEAERGWVQHGADYAAISLYPKGASWYMGANVPGKPRVLLPYIGGVDGYRRICDEVVEGGYLGFALHGENRESVDTTIIRQVQPDVALMLEAMAEMEVPPLSSMSLDEARMFYEASSAMGPPGPEVGEVIDATMPVNGTDLAYRLYRPDTEGPHPVVVYFHGGGWVLGSLDSDDAFCRDLCRQSDAIFISVNYRHAPEHRFPVPVEDAYGATVWVSENLASLGGTTGEVAVAGWSAGANLAAVVAQTARDKNGPALRGQLLLTPVTDSEESASYIENGDGYVLTADTMRWFWDHYADPEDRADPNASPLRAESLAGLPPAVVITGQFDPLRDEGRAYANAMAAAGVPVQQIQARGHTHTSTTAVGVLPSGAPIRTEMAAGIRGFFRSAG